MADTVSLTCPSCGSRLQVTSDLERFACSHCGNELVVRRGGGIISLAPVLEGIQRIEAGIGRLSNDFQNVNLSASRAASELAIPRLEREIGQLRIAAESFQPVGLGWPTGCLVFGILGVITGLGAVTADAATGASTLLVYIFWCIGAYMWRKSRVAQRQEVENRQAAIYQEITRKQQEIENHRRNVAWRQPD